jgi:hypothetical protein
MGGDDPLRTDLRKMAPVRRKLTGLPVGTKWKGIDGNNYEITGFYTVFGKNLYHVKVNGKHIVEGRNSIKLIKEEQVKEWRRKE